MCVQFSPGRQRCAGNQSAQPVIPPKLNALGSRLVQAASFQRRSRRLLSPFPRFTLWRDQEDSITLGDKRLGRKALECFSFGRGVVGACGACAADRLPGNAAVNCLWRRLGNVVRAQHSRHGFCFNLFIPLSGLLGRQSSCTCRHSCFRTIVWLLEISTTAAIPVVGSNWMSRIV